MGVINTVFFYFIYALFIFIGLDYILAVTFSTSISMFFSFRAFGMFVFNNNDSNLLFKFALVSVANYLLNVIIIYLFKKIGYNSYIAGLISVTIVSFSSFILNKYYVFKIR